MFKQTLVISLLLSSSVLFAQTTPSADEMQTKLSKAIPEITIDSMKASPVPGFFEITSGPVIFYASDDGQYIFYGDLLQIKGDEIENITDISRAKVVKEALAKIDPKTYIVFPATTDKVVDTVTIGTDVDCGYCRKLHEEVPALNAAGITVRYLAFPRTPAGTPSYEKSAKIWCAKDPKQAIDDAFAGKEVTGSADCKHPLPEHAAFVQSIGANATPIIILDNGLVIPGYVPAKELIELIKTQQ